MMRYVSNAGIILTSNGTSIGIDCFSKDTNKIYQDTSGTVCQELLQEIETRKLNTLIFTHEHSDHFCAQDVKESCEMNANLEVFAGRGVIKELELIGVSKEQLVEVNVPCKKYFGEICIEFLETKHEGEQYADVQNLTLLITKENKKLVVTGDAAPTTDLFRGIAGWSKDVDWLFAPFPYVGLRSTRKLICENLNVKNIFVLHQPRPEADTQNWVANTKKVCELTKDDLPYPIFPEKLGEWYCI